MKKEYKKIIRIQKLSKVVGCLQKFEAKKIELLLLVVIIVLIILCLMNVLVIPWKILNKSLLINGGCLKASIDEYGNTKYYEKHVDTVKPDNIKSIEIICPCDDEHKFLR